MNISIVKYLAVITVVFLTINPQVPAADTMGELGIDLEISATSLHEWMPSVTYNPIDNEFVVLWHTTGVREQGGKVLYSLHGRRYDADGNPVGMPLSPISSIGPERRILPRAAHNHFNNQYMVAFVMGQDITEWDPFITIMDHDGGGMYGPAAISAQLTKANHTNIAFNSKRRQYLVVYNDSRNGNADVFGIILDEAGNIVKADFAVNASKGEQINAYVCYNPADDTYLVNWEDFRNVSQWRDQGDIYGALLDGAGNIAVPDIPMCDDHESTTAGDQRHNNIAYNPDKNEFFVSWTDTRPTLDNVGIVGRFIRADGTPAGPDFTAADAPESQIFPHAVYVQKRKQYFMIWDDSRNDAPGTPWRDAKNRDPYAKWLSDTGGPAGPDIPLAINDGVQRYSDLAYNPLMDRFLIAWRDEVNEEVLSEGDPSGGHITESGGNIMGKIYGMPAFLTGRVVERQTNSPVDAARVTVMGLGMPRFETANIGGWFNIPDEDQRQGTYIIMVYKRGYRIGFTTAKFQGEPLKITIELEKR